MRNVLDELKNVAQDLIMADLRLNWRFAYTFAFIIASSQM